MMMIIINSSSSSITIKAINYIMRLYYRIERATQNSIDDINYYITNKKKIFSIYKHTNIINYLAPWILYLTLSFSNLLNKFTLICTRFKSARHKTLDIKYIKIYEVALSSNFGGNEKITNNWAEKESEWERSQERMCMNYIVYLRIWEFT